MMTSSNGIFSTLLALCAGNSLVTGEVPAQRPVTRSFDVFFDLCVNKWLSKQSWGWWFEMPSCPLWSHLCISYRGNTVLHQDFICVLIINFKPINCRRHHIVSDTTNIFHIFGPLWGESSSHHWFPSHLHTKQVMQTLWCFSCGVTQTNCGFYSQVKIQDLLDLKELISVFEAPPGDLRCHDTHVITLQ